MKIFHFQRKPTDTLTACNAIICGYTSEDIRLVNCKECREKIVEPDIGLYRLIKEKYPRTDFTEEKYHENHYQKELRDWIIENEQIMIIETGIYYGVSSNHILEALDTLDNGMLISIDPNPLIPTDVEHPCWFPYKDISQNVLPQLLDRPHTWDVFLHDSDHGYECQTFEYEFALNHLVRPGGYILTDDPFWGSPPHMAWTKFIERNKDRVEVIPKIGHACWGVQVKNV